MFEQILSPLDGSVISECALPHAIAFANAFNGSILLLQVLDKNQSTDGKQLLDLVNWEIKRTEAQSYLDGVSQRINKRGTQVFPRVAEGEVVEVISETVRNENFSLIILSSHGRSGTGRWGISSVTQKVILGATSSLMLVRASDPPVCEMENLQYQQILVPLDGSKRAEIVLPVVILLARHHHSVIHFVHVIKPPEIPRQVPLTEEEKQLGERIILLNHEQATRYLEQMEHQALQEGVQVQSHLLTNGNPAIALHDLIKERNMDLLALSAHGYSAQTEWPYGSLVNNFILYCKIPLLIIQDRPPKQEAQSDEMKIREHPEQ